jgi:hypothetical protein
MPVTDEQEAALHAMLAGRFDEHQRLLGAINTDTGRIGYSALVSAAFAVAADERFPEGTPAGEIVEYVGDVRSRGEDAGRIDPLVAERVILAVTSDEKTDDIDPQVSYETQLTLLAALIADAHPDAHPDDAALNTFLGKARKLADSWIA